MEYVIKRDGRKMPFSADKIINAIKKAMTACNKSDDALATYIAAKISETEDNLPVEKIQDLVEKYLMESNYKDVAKEFILYRADRTKARTANSDMMKAIADKINAKNVDNQNANVDEKSFGGRVGEAADELMRRFALDYCMSEKSARNHLNNRIYIHDLNRYAVGQHNCLTIPIDDLLANGFTTRQTDIRPANSINTAFQLLAVIFQVQSLQQFGKRLCRIKTL